MVEFDEESSGSFEEMLVAIAQTEQWDEDGIVGNIRNYQAMLETLRDKLDGVRSWMADSGEFDCSARDDMQAKANEVIRNIEAHYSANQRCLTDMTSAIESHNEGIVAANNVTLPGSRLNAAQEQQIMDATEPMNVVVPGLGTLTGMMGIAGVNLISRLLASHREDEAEKQYRSIKDKASRVRPQPPGPIPVVDMGWGPGPVPPVPDSSDSNGFGSSKGAGAAAAAVVAGVGAVAGAGHRSALSVSAVSAGRHSSGDVASSRVGAARPSVSSSILQGSAGRADGVAGAVDRDDYRAGSVAGSGDDGRRDDDGYLYEWDEDGTYRYDSDRDAWVRVDEHGVDVDSYSVQGVSSLSSAASGAGVAAGGAAVAGVAGRAGMMSAAAGTGGMAGPVGAVGSVGAAGGVGSFYANNPVTASVSPTSSIRGAQGLATGLRNNATAAGATGANGRANPAMMGSGAGAGGGGDKKRKQRLGYVAPVIEDGEEFSPTPIGNMAGHRRSAEES